jgi:hypothetical protein
MPFCPKLSIVIVNALTMPRAKGGNAAFRVQTAAGGAWHEYCGPVNLT